MLYGQRQLYKYIQTKDVYEDTADVVKKRFDTSDYGIERPLPIGKSKKVIGLMKDELGGKILTEFIELRPKTNCFLKKLKEQTSV